MADAEGSRTVTIDRPPAEVWAVLHDVGTFPQWNSALKEAVVESSDDQGRPLRASFLIDATVAKVRYTLDYAYEGDTQSWTLVKGDGVKKVEGSYTVVPAGSGSSVTYRQSVEVAIKVPGFLKRRGEQAVMSSGTEDLKKRVER